ncbi:MAG: hypothetical protein ABIC40_00455 [bacterium]
MDYSLSDIYRRSLIALKGNILIYLLLFVWSVVQWFVVLFLLTVLVLFSLAILAAVNVSDPSLQAFTPIGFLTGLFLFVVLLLATAGRAGLLGYLAKVRRGERAGAMDFVQSIFKFTGPLLVGGIIISMLTSIPLLVFLNYSRETLSGIIPEVLTTGWNFQIALETLGKLINMLSILAIFQTIIFFWIAPWDEMLVLYRISFSEALARSFIFVFSKRYFFRVLGLIILNVIIAQAALILGNFNSFTDALDSGFADAYASALIGAPGNNLTGLFQFLLIPFFAFTQLFLLPWTPVGERQADTPEHEHLYQPFGESTNIV